MLRIVVCVSGGGTNLQAVLDAIDAGKITNAQVAAVISNSAGAKALQRARDHHIPGILMSPRSIRTGRPITRRLLPKWPV